jgi:hypothetical protein
VERKLLSIAGKEILLKAVAQAIPVYAMSVLQIPKGVCKRMMDAIAKFWWGDDENSNKMHWLTWWKLCYPKNEGEWASQIFSYSIWLCLQSKYGD